MKRHCIYEKGPGGMLDFDTWERGPAVTPLERLGKSAAWLQRVPLLQQAGEEAGSAILEGSV